MELGLCSVKDIMNTYEKNNEELEINLVIKIFLTMLD